MKTKITLLALVTLLMISCDKYYDMIESTGGKGKGEDSSITNGYSKSQFIVRFEENLSESEKVDIREEFGIGKNFELCSCGDPNLELWGIAPDGESVELLVERLRRRSRAEGDFLYDMTVEPIKGGFTTKGIGGQLDVSLISSSPAKKQINIAIIDSGLDYGQPFTTDPYNKPYLYDTSNLSDCDSPTGWNFTKEGTHNDVLDYNGHGSLVTKIITTELDAKKYDYTILPIKAFTKTGEGSYWNVVCAFGYLQEIQAKGGTIDLVNASFGKSVDKILFDDKSLLNTMIDELGKTGALVITSAGNESLNTDGEKRHFPSGFASNNILSVGGYNRTYTNVPSIHRRSNYGRISIDMAAPFNDWSVSFNETNTHYRGIEGTSFSTAYVTGLIGITAFEKEIQNPIELKNNFLNTTYNTVHYSYILKQNIANGIYVK